MRLVLPAAAVLSAIAALSLVSRVDTPGAEASPAALAPAAVGAAEARELIAAGALLADVREPAELAETGKLQGALNLPLTRLKQLAADGRTPAEIVDKERPVVLYCQSGRRAREAGEILLRQGFRRVYNLGGFADAVAGGFPAG